MLLTIPVQVHQAHITPFWYDELFTVHVSMLRTPEAIWRALLNGVDAMPPLYYWLNGWLSRLPVDPHIAFRLLPIAGFCLGMIGVYGFVATGFGAAWGLVAAMLLGLSPMALRAVEARPYTLIVGFLAVAAAIWQRADERWYWPPLLAVSLALAVAFHHLAIVGVGCFAAGELAEVLVARKLRWKIWLSLIVSAIPLLLMLPALLRFKATFGPHFWSQPSFGSIATSYVDLSGLPAGFVQVFIMLAGLAIVDFMLQHRRAGSAGLDGPALSIPETTLATGFLLLPPILIVFMKIQGGGYTQRYASPVVIGLAVAFVFVLRFLSPAARPTWLACALLLVSLRTDAQRGLEGWSATPAAGFSPAAAAATTRDLESLVARYGVGDDLPIVLEEAHRYLPDAYYAKPALAKRLYFLADPTLALQFRDRDTDERNMRALSSAIPDIVQVADPAEFFRSHHNFIAIAGEGWLTQYLLAQGSRLELKQRGGGLGDVYLVHLDG